MPHTVSMIRVLVLSAILVVGSAVEETKTPSKEIKTKEGDTHSEPSSVQSTLNDAYFGLDYNQLLDSRKGRDEDVNLTEEENRIVQDVYSPDYYEPNLILDYRYMKSGGRGYARSDGGQILILPKRNHMPTLYNNYDTLIEYLRLKHLEETESKWLKILKQEHAVKSDPQHGPDAYYGVLDEGRAKERLYRSNTKRKQ